MPQITRMNLQFAHALKGTPPPPPFARTNVDNKAVLPKNLPICGKLNTTSWDFETWNSHILGLALLVARNSLKCLRQGAPEPALEKIRQNDKWGLDLVEILA